MQNTISLHYILIQLDKLKDSLNSLSNEHRINTLEADLALEKLRNIYDSVLNLKKCDAEKSEIILEEEEITKV